MDDTKRDDVIRWNGSAWLAALYIVCGAIGIGVGLISVFTQPSGALHLLTVLCGLFAVSLGIQKAKNAVRADAAARDR